MEENQKSVLMYFLEVHCKRSNKLGGAIADEVKGCLHHTIVKAERLPEVIKWVKAIIDVKRKDYPRCNGGKLEILEFADVYNTKPCKHGSLQFYAKDNADYADVMVYFTPCEEIRF